ncbi:MAG: BolA family transcriptional regulator [Rickettsiales bacterium]|nr:BolA family transcriptional regulator [Rickettsiales bacterium]
MPMESSEIESRIKQAIPDAVIEFTDLAGDNDHWQIKVTSSAFENKPRIMQHRMVMGALGEDMGTTLHALSISTHTP